MALTFGTRRPRDRYAGEGKYKTYTNVTLDASYVNGTGYTITNTQLGLPAKATIDEVFVMPPHGGFYFTVVIAADGQSITLRAWTGALAEAANNLAGLNGLVLRIKAVGN